jgi:hypothetical protein
MARYLGAIERRDGWWCVVLAGVVVYRSSTRDYARHLRRTLLRIRTPTEIKAYLRMIQRQGEEHRCRGRQIDAEYLADEERWAQEPGWEGIFDELMYATPPGADLDGHSISHAGRVGLRPPAPGLETLDERIKERTQRVSPDPTYGPIKTD